MFCADLPISSQINVQLLTLDTTVASTGVAVPLRHCMRALARFRDTDIDASEAKAFLVFQALIYKQTNKGRL